MTNQAIDWTKAVKSLTPDKPFFIYFAPGATHAPHHVPKEWIAKYKGKFDQGWDKLREETLARQKQARRGSRRTPSSRPSRRRSRTGTSSRPTSRSSSPTRWRCSPVTASSPITRPAGWSRPSRTWARSDNTLIFYILGDNGASAEGGMNGLFNETTYFNGVAEKVEDILKHYDELGGPTVVRSLRGRLGRGGRHAVHLDEAGRRELRRHAQRHGRPLAQAHQGPRRGAVAVASRHRRRADDPGSGRPARAEGGQRHAPDPDRRREPGLHVRRRPGARAGTRPSTSRSSATAPSTTTAGWPAPSTGCPGSPSRGRPCRTTCGSCTTREPTSAW